MNKRKTCAFTGHRDMKDDVDEVFFTDCLRQFILKGYDTFLCGMARGFDLYAGQTVLKLKEEFPQIKLVACVPCPNQDRYFGEEDKLLYKEVLQSCSEVKLLSDHFYNGCMQLRDRFMVDNCSLVIAYDRAQDGGTKYTVAYALSQNKKLFII